MLKIYITYIKKQIKSWYQRVNIWVCGVCVCVCVCVCVLAYVCVCVWCVFIHLYTSDIFVYFRGFFIKKADQNFPDENILTVYYLL